MLHIIFIIIPFSMSKDSEYTALKFFMIKNCETVIVRDETQSSSLGSDFISILSRVVGLY